MLKLCKIEEIDLYGFANFVMFEIECSLLYFCRVKFTSLVSFQAKTFLTFNFVGEFLRIMVIGRWCLTGSLPVLPGAAVVFLDRLFNLRYVCSPLP